MYDNICKHGFLAETKEKNVLIFNNSENTVFLSFSENHFIRWVYIIEKCKVKQQVLMKNLQQVYFILTEPCRETSAKKPLVRHTSIYSIGESRLISDENRAEI